MLIVAGAIGNLIDRIFYTASYLGGSHAGVVDFIDFCGIWDAVFNIADCCVVIAACMFIVYTIVEMVKDYIKENKENTSLYYKVGRDAYEIGKAIEKYSSRDRRYGGVK